MEIESLPTRELSWHLARSAIQWPIGEVLAAPVRCCAMPIVHRIQRKPSAGTRLRSYILAAWAAGMLLMVPGQAAEEDATAFAFRLLAGSPGPGWTDGTGPAARFARPRGVAVDAGGNVYVVDSGTSVIRRITPEGVTTTIAGTAGTEDVFDGVGPAAHFSHPSAITVAPDGALYVVDASSVIRRIAPDRSVTTVAGKAGVQTFADGSGSSARFNNPAGICSDPTGNLYIADTWNNAIRKMTPAGVVTTIAGRSGYQGWLDGVGTEAAFYHPEGIAIDESGVIYVTDSAAHTLRRVTSDGVVTTIAGSPGQSGSRDGAGLEAQFNTPKGLALAGDGNLYIADAYNGTLRRVTPDGIVTTLAGLARNLVTLDGAREAARFSEMVGLAAAQDGSLYVSEIETGDIRRVTSSGEVTTFAGRPSGAGSADGIGTGARFHSPVAVAEAADGVVYVADAGNHVIRRMAKDGAVTILAGAAGESGSVDGDAGVARFSNPSGVTVDADGDVYVADTGNHTIRKIAPAGLVSTVAGVAGISGTDDGTGAAARFNQPQGIAVDAGGNLYVADFGNSAIRRVTPAGEVTTLAGLAGAPGALDGTRAQSRFSSPMGVAVAADGTVYVADAGNHAIRCITGDSVTTLAGRMGRWGTDDGVAGAARFSHPQALTVDAGGVVYVADTWNHEIRKITGNGLVTTIAGSPYAYVFQEGVGLGAFFSEPTGVALGGGGRLLVVDRAAHVLAVGTSAPPMLQGPLSVVGNVGDSFSYHVVFNANGVVTAVNGLPPGLSFDADSSTISGILTTAGNFQISFSATGDTGAGTGTLALHVNSAPTISTIPDQAIDGDGVIGPLTFTVGDEESAPWSLGISVTSSNQALVPNSAIYVQGTDADRTVTITPTPHLAGDATITVTVQDTTGETATSFHVTVRGVPTITTPGNQVIPVGGSSLRQAFTIDDPDTPAEDLQVTAESSDPALFPAAGIVLAGTGVDRTITLSPAAGRAGVATITLVVSDGGRTATTTFVARVGPGFGSVESQTLAAGTSVLAIPLTIVPGATLALDCEVTAESSDSSLIPPGNFSIRGNGAQRTLIITPAAGRSGVATITVTVTDGTNSASTSFGLTVEPGSRSAPLLWAAGGLRPARFLDAPVRLATDVATVEHSGGQTLFIKTDGTLWSTPGYDSSWHASGGVDASLLYPQQVATAVASACASGSSLYYVGKDSALRATGEGAAVFFGGYYQPTEQVLISWDVKAVTAGTAHALYLKTDGTVWSSGDDTYGQLGDGTTNSRYLAMQVASDGAAVSAGSYHTMLLKTDGTLWAAGRNEHGQLGDGTTVDRSAWVSVATGVSAVSAGSDFTLLLKTDGTVWAMGRNDNGQLGDGTTTDRSSPVKIASGVQRIDAGVRSGFFVKSDGTLWLRRLKPPGFETRQITTDGGVVEVVAAPDDTRWFYRTAAGAMWQVDAAGASTRVAEGVVAMSAGRNFHAYLKRDGTLWGRGGEAGRILFGNGSADAQVAGDVRSLSAGESHLLFVKSDHTLWGMGSVVGGFGSEDTGSTYATTPKQLATGVIKAGAGSTTNAYLRTDGSLLLRTLGWGAWSSLRQLLSGVQDFSVGLFNVHATGGGGSVINLVNNAVASSMGGVLEFADGSVGAAVLIQQGGATLPTIAQAPADTQVAVGDRLVLEVQAAGNGPFAFQWRKDGVAIAGADSNEDVRSRYVVPYATLADAGSYTVSITNAAGAVESEAVTVDVTVSGENRAPAIGAIADQTTQEDVATPAVAFTIDDPDTAATALVVTATSSNTALIPAANIVLGGGGADRTVKLMPAANASGSATITLTVSDGALTASTNFLLTVTAVNDAPTIATIANQTTKEDTATGTIGFKVADADTAATALVVTATSSNTALIPAANIVLGGSGADRTVKLTPAANANGVATITLTVSDGALTAVTHFTLTVTPVNDAPAIAKPADVVIARGANRTIAFKVSDLETSASALTVTRASSNTALLPTANLVLGGSGGNRTLKLTPVSTKTGTTTVTLAVADANGGKASTSFKVTVANPPAIAAIASQTTNEDTTTGTIAVKLSDTDTPTAKLTLSAKSSNATLVPANAYTFGGSGANRTLRIKPGVNQTGTATITLTVSDGLLTANRSFHLTVKPVNDRPTISAIANQTTNRNTATKAIAFKIADAETAATKLKLTKVSSNTALLPTANILLGGSGENRTVTLKPAPNKTGTAQIMLTVSDGQLSANRTFTLTVNAPPTISKLANQTIAKSTSTPALKFTIGDAETTASKLKLTKTSSNTKLVPTTAIVLGGSGANRTVKITPVKNLTGSAKITLTVSDGTATASTAFWVTVAASVKKTDTATAAKPVLTTQPQPQVVKTGAAVTFAVKASGATHYQWTRDGRTLAGATAAALKLAPVKLTDAGGYAVRLTNASGTTTSRVAELTVVDAHAAMTRQGPVAAVTQTMTIAGAADTLTLSVLLPDGWRYLSGVAPGSTSTPKSGDTALLEWVWPDVPAKSLTFTYVLEVPAAKALPGTLDALAQIRAGDLTTKLLFEEALR